MIKKLFVVVSVAVTAVLSASAEFSMSEDFTVADARGGAYGIVPLRDTALSHQHGWIEDGVYRIPVEGNRHVIATPRLRDFRLEAGRHIEQVAGLPAFEANDKMIVPGAWDAMSHYYNQRGTGCYRRRFTLAQAALGGFLVVDGASVRSKYWLD